MMARKNILLGLSLYILLATACKKEEILLFDREETGIYFQHGGTTVGGTNNDRYYDSSEFSFSVAPITTTDTVLGVRIRAMGKTKDHPRPIKLVVDKENTTATEGVHYEINPDTAAMPAGAGSYTFRVKFIRHEDMLYERLKLTLKLEDNDHFNVYIKNQKNTNVHSSVGEQIAADRFTFIVSEFYTQPFYWQIFGNTYFGPWSISKYRYVNTILGWTPEDWQNAGNSALSPVLLGRFVTAALTVRNALQALADAGTPMLDDNGDPMQLGAGYQVIY